MFITQYKLANKVYYYSQMQRPEGRDRQCPCISYISAGGRGGDYAHHVLVLCCTWCLLRSGLSCIALHCVLLLHCLVPSNIYLLIIISLLLLRQVAAQQQQGHHVRTVITCLLPIIIYIIICKAIMHIQYVCVICTALITVPISCLRGCRCTPVLALFPAVFSDP